MNPISICWYFQETYVHSETFSLLFIMHTYIIPVDGRAMYQCDLH
jgi:hypothetical protein